MSKLNVPPLEMEAAFVRWFVDRTTRELAVRVTAVWALRADFRMYVRDNDLCNNPSDDQFAWMLDDANIAIEILPAQKTGAPLPFACGIRLKGDM